MNRPSGTHLIIWKRGEIGFAPVAVPVVDTAALGTGIGAVIELVKTGGSKRYLMPPLLLQY